MTEKLSSTLKDWVAPILAATLTALTLYGWAFEAQFNKQVEAHKPAMTREIEMRLDRQQIQIERDRIELMGQLDKRLTRIETMLEQMKGSK